MPKEAKIYKTLEDYLKEGFYKHPTKDCVANKIGKIINIKTNWILLGSANDCDYLMVTIDKKTIFQTSVSLRSCVRRVN